MNYIQKAMNQASELTMKAYRRAAQKGLLPDKQTADAIAEIPKDASNGDFSSTFALQAARTLGMPPRKIAEILCGEFELEGSCFKSVEFAGAGFLNFRLADGWYSDVVSNILEEKGEYGRSVCDNPKKIMVEFVSANPTGPMHMGNARGGVLGDCIASVLSLCGNNVSREFYINNAGNQVEMFGRSLNARYLQKINGEDSVEFPEDGYHGDDIKELAGQFLEQYGTEPAQMSERQRIDMLIEYALPRNIEKMKSDLKRYGIEYDVWYPESELHESGYVKQTVDILTQKGYTYEKDGALWLKSTEFGCEKDDVLRRANGFYTYFAADIAYHRDKLERRGFDLVINVWGADHHGHVARLKGAIDALGLDGTHRIEVVLMQLVQLVRDGQAVRMSKRTGKAITLCDLLDEIPIDAARFFFNSRSPGTHLEFDLGLAVRCDSENPVYYIQYAHARVMSILRNLQQAGIDTENIKADLSVLSSDSERALIKTLAMLPAEIIKAAAERDPSCLNHYADDVASHFHRFYTENRITDAPEHLLAARVMLCRATAAVIKNLLSAIGVSAPDKM